MRLMFAARAIDNMAGGVERMIITIMNAMVVRGHQVELLTWDLNDATAFYPMAPEIIWHRLSLGDPREKAGAMLKVWRARDVRRILRHSDPQAIICFQDGPFVSLRSYGFGLGLTFIAAERNSPTRFDYTTAGKRKEYILQSFRSARRILIQCESYRALYPAYLHGRIVTIPNPVSLASLRACPNIPNEHGRYSLLSVGRLGYQKNYAVLIEAFARLSQTFPDWDLVIIGDGEEREKLNVSIAAHGLTDRVFLPGTSKFVEEDYARAHGFVLPSRWEGFPNALAEAMAHGLPSIGFESCAGIPDLITAGQNGLLASGNGDPNSLAYALAVAMANPELRTELGAAAMGSMHKYTPERIFDKWERVLSEVVRA